MIKNILVLICMLSAVSVKAQVTVNIKWQNIKTVYTGDTIYYERNRKLTWSDFKGRPVASSFAAAITESGFGYQMTMQSLRGRTTINITVYCYFNKSKSWVKKNMDSDYALLHEQHHFDITYINTCLFIQKLKEANFTRSNCGPLSEKIHDESYNALLKMQNEYDGETSNGRKKDEQAYWNKKIDQQLETLITD